MVHILQDILKTKFSALFSNKCCQICQICSCPLFVYNNSVIQSLVFYNKAVVLIYKIPIPVLECDTKPRNKRWMKANPDKCHFLLKPSALASVNINSFLITNSTEEIGIKFDIEIFFETISLASVRRPVKN